MTNKFAFDKINNLVRGWREIIRSWWVTILYSKLISKSMDIHFMCICTQCGNPKDLLSIEKYSVKSIYCKLKVKRLVSRIFWENIFWKSRQKLERREINSFSVKSMVLLTKLLELLNSRKFLAWKNRQRLDHCFFGKNKKSTFFLANQCFH